MFRMRTRTLLAAAVSVALGVGAAIGGATAATAAAPNAIGGTVTGLSGAPLDAATVYLGRWDATKKDFDDIASVAPVSGRYLFDNLPDGDYSVYFKPLAVAGTTTPLADEVWNNANPYLGGDLVTLTAGTRRADIDASLVAAAVVSGKVLAPTLGAGDAKVEVTVRDAATGQWLETGDSFPVAVDGSYRVTGLFPGTYRLIAAYRTTAGAVDRVSPDFTLSAGASVTWSPTLSLGSPPRDAALVRALYADYLSRSPADSEINGWVSVLRNGGSPADLSRGFASSDEYRLIRIDEAYQKVLRRGPDDGGRINWLVQVRANRMTTDDLQKYFLASDEYWNAAQVSQQSVEPGEARWVSALYRDLLSRPAEPAGSAGWVSIARTQGRAAVVNAMWNEPEVAQARVRAMYVLYLGRDPDPAGLASWTQVDIRTGDFATRSAITSSQEYRDRATRRFS